MKKIIFNICIAVPAMLGSCGETVPAEESTQAGPADSIQLINKIYDFGTIKKTDTLTCSFEFINRSGKSLVIRNVKPSCGCTTAEFSKDPIMRDGKGKLDIVFVPTSTGYTKKSVVLETNFNPPFHVFYLEGNVE